MTELDISHNDRLTGLPLSFTGLNRLNRVITTGTHLAIFDSGRAQGLSLPSVTLLHSARGPSSLADIALNTILRHTVDDPADEQQGSKLALAAHLPPHLADKVLQGYSCELCNAIAWPGMVAYADTEVEVSMLVRAEEGEDAVLLPDGSPGKAIRLCGRACLTCCRRLAGRWAVRWRAG